jgi:Fic/DOC family protein
MRLQLPDPWVMPVELARFLRESLDIEGIERSVTTEEIDATITFLRGPLNGRSVCQLQAVYAPGNPLRDRPGMNVRVGRYIAPAGGPPIKDALDGMTDGGARPDPYEVHVAFELLRPFMDGNGRTGRAVWVWLMLESGQNPFTLSFLHRFYYQTLAAAA